MLCTKNLMTCVRWLLKRECEKKIHKETDVSFQCVINLLNVDDELQSHGSASARKHEHGVCRVLSKTGRVLCNSKDWQDQFIVSLFSKRAHQSTNPFHMPHLEI